MALRGITLVSVSAASGTLHVWSMARLVAAAAEAEAVREQRQGCDALLVARPLASLEPGGRAGAEQGGVPPTVCSVALSGDERCVVSGASDGSSTQTLIRDPTESVGILSTPPDFSRSRLAWRA